MDISDDFWTTRLAAAKRQQHSLLDRLAMEDFEPEEEVRTDFTCPYCYDDYDIASLCSHLEDDHPSDSGVSNCPVCSVKVTRGMLNHIVTQHGHLIKLHRRRRLRRAMAVSGSQSALSQLSRDLREAHLQVLLGNVGAYRSSSSNSSGSANNAGTDSLLSMLVLNMVSSEADGTSKTGVPMLSSAESSVRSMTSRKAWKPSPEPLLSSEERETMNRQATVRATFVQDLLLSTLFSD